MIKAADSLSVAGASKETPFSIGRKTKKRNDTKKVFIVLQHFALPNSMRGEFPDDAGPPCDRKKDLSRRADCLRAVPSC